jgi:hypothetical protein
LAPKAAPPSSEVRDDGSRTPAETGAATAAGLVAWRTPDCDGVARANRHAPDALELALIG